jgi:hypothetical protein
MARFKVGDLVCHEKQPDLRGVFEGYIYGTKGLCYVRWGAGIRERVSVSELRRVKRGS